MRISALLLLAALGPGTPAMATILTFDQCGGDPNAAIQGVCNGGLVNQSYGDRAAAEIMNGGLFRYINDGEGWTPNVVAGYGPDPNTVRGYFTGYRPLANVLWVEKDPGIFQLTLQADTGFHVLLYNFDLAIFSDAVGSVTAKHIRVSDQSGTHWLNLTNRAVVNAETFFFFIPAASGNGGFLQIEFDLTNLPLDVNREYLAIDNIRFGQAAATTIPEPGSSTLLGIGLALGVFLRRRT